MTTINQLSSTWKLVISILACEIIGILGGLSTAPEIKAWFSTLNKPSWNPPSYLFAPVWTTLYLLMGISFWLIWKSKTPEPKKTNAMLLFGLQLFFNFCWSLIFFKYHSPAFAFIDIILLFFAILFTIFLFGDISSKAAWLLVPYISWVSFASILNYAIWTMNK